MLHIYANSTRLAGWKSQMGFVRPTAQLVAQEGLLLLRKISDIIPGGGRIPLIHLQVAKRHPLMYLESVPDGVKARVFTQKEESRRIDEEEKRRQYLIERFSDEVYAECVKVGSTGLSTRKNGVALTLVLGFFFRTLMRTLHPSGVN